MQILSHLVLKEYTNNSWYFTLFGILFWFGLWVGVKKMVCNEGENTGLGVNIQKMVAH